MRVLVTGTLNPFGRAVVEALSGAGHSVRAFGVAAGSDPFHGMANVECYPGVVELGGSIEPVAVECQAIVHCAPLDEPGKDKVAHAIHISRGTLYSRYGAERELVNRFVVLLPEAVDRTYSRAVSEAEDYAKGTRGTVVSEIIRARDPKAAAQQVLNILSKIVAA